MTKVSATVKKTAKKILAEKARMRVYKYWHDQYRRNSKYQDWTAEKKARALKRKMAKYDA